MPAHLVHDPALQLRRSGTHDTSVISGASDVHALRAEWTELLLDSEHPSPFLSWEWMTTWLQSHGRKGSPHILLVRRRQDQQLVALAPLYYTSSGYPFGLRTISFMGTGVGADHLAFVVRRGVGDAVRLSLATHLFSASDWDILDFARIDERLANDLAEAISRRDQGDLACSHQLADVCPYIPLPGTWEDFLGVIGSDRRKSLARRWRRLGECGEVVIRRAQTMRDLEEAWQILLRLHQDRRQAVGDRSAFLTGRSMVFHREFAKMALERGWLRLYLLQVGNQYVAAEYCLKVGNRVADFQGGFDEKWARYGVGSLLIAHAIREAIAEGAVEFDLLRGGEQYKQQQWAAELREDRSLAVWRRRRRVELLVAARRWVAGAKVRVRRRLGTVVGPRAITAKAEV